MPDRSLLPALPAVSAHRTDSIRNLGEVVVKAKTYKEVIPAQTLKGEELRKLNSFSVADAIRYFSGLQIKDYGGVAGLKTVNIRSMGTNHTGVYYNGIQLGNAQNGQVDLGKFSLDNIEEISLYNGQKSDIFQSAREFGSSGSIYLTTRRPGSKEKDANLAAKVKFGSYGLLNPALLYEHKISDNISAAVSAEWITSQGDYKFRYRRVDVSGALKYDTTAVRHNSDIDALRIDAGLYGSSEGKMERLRLPLHLGKRDSGSHREQCVEAFGTVVGPQLFPPRKSRMACMARAEHEVQHEIRLRLHPLHE